MTAKLLRPPSHIHAAQSPLPSPSATPVFGQSSTSYRLDLTDFALYFTEISRSSLYQHWLDQTAPNGRAASYALMGEDGTRADPYVAYCIDSAVRIFGQWADHQIEEAMSERGDDGKSVREYADVYREVMQIEMSAAEKREKRRIATEMRQMMFSRGLTWTIRSKAHSASMSRTTEPPPKWKRGCVAWCKTSPS